MGKKNLISSNRCNSRTTKIVDGSPSRCPKTPQASKVARGVHPASDKKVYDARIQRWVDCFSVKELRVQSYVFERKSAQGKFKYKLKSKKKLSQGITSYDMAAYLLSSIVTLDQSGMTYHVYEFDGAYLGCAGVIVFNHDKRGGMLLSLNSEKALDFADKAIFHMKATENFAPSQMLRFGLYFNAQVSESGEELTLWRLGSQSLESSLVKIFQRESQTRLRIGHFVPDKYRPFFATWSVSHGHNHSSNSMTTEDHGIFSPGPHTKDKTSALMEQAQGLSKTTNKRKRESLNTLHPSSSLDKGSLSSSKESKKRKSMGSFKHDSWSPSEDRKPEDRKPLAEINTSVVNARPSMIPFSINNKDDKKVQAPKLPFFL